MRGSWLMILLSLAACEAPSSHADGGPHAVDVTVLCADALPLDLGRCVSIDGVPCTGAELDSVFGEMPPDGMVVPTTGPQGSQMLALAIRASGIVPGDPTSPASRDNPVVDLQLYDESGAELARLGVRSGFSASADLTDTYESAQLFVIVDGVGSIGGQDLIADAQLVDSAGNVRCGTLHFRTP